jgi:hypothetical protein
MVVSSIGKPYLASDTNGVFQSLETHTLRHFVALLPQGRIQDQDHQEPNTAYTAKGEEAYCDFFLAP